MQVELLKPHVHAGVLYQPGAVIALDEDLAQWLLDAGIARNAVPPTVPKPFRRTEEKTL